MADIKTAEDAQKYLREEIVPSAKQAMVQHQKAKASAPPAIATLKRAVAEANVDRVALQQREVETQVKELERALAWNDAVSDRFSKVVRSGADIATVTKQLDALAVTVGQQKKELKGWLDDASAALGEAQKFRKSAGAVEQTAAADWSHLMAELRQFAEGVTGRRDLVRDELQDARKAAAGRDAAALKAAQSRAGGYKSKERAAVKFKAGFDWFAKKYPGAKFGPGFSEQMKRDRTELAALLKQCAADEAETDKLHAELARLAPAAPDVARAAKALGLKSAQVPALKKALEGPEAQLLKALDAIGAALDPKLPGREVLARLKREKIL